MLCRNLNVCSGFYYDEPVLWLLRTDLVDAAALGASGSEFAKHVFQRTYGKATQSIVCEVCVRSD